MAQLAAAYKVIDSVTTLMLEVGTRVGVSSASSHDDSSLASVHKASSSRKRHQNQQRNSVANSMVDSGVRAEPTQLLLIDSQGSAQDFAVATAGVPRLREFERAHRHRTVTAEEFAGFVVDCCKVIRDVNDYAQYVYQQQIDLVRSQNFEASVSSDLRPVSASMTAPVASGGGAYGVVDNAVAATFDTGPLPSTLLMTPITPYETPGVSVPVSRTVSPPPGDDEDEVDAATLMAC